MCFSRFLYAALLSVLVEKVSDYVLNIPMSAGQAVLLPSGFLTVLWSAVEGRQLPSRNCFERSSLCFFPGSIFVSLCRCSMGAIFRLPVTVRRAAFCLVCSVFQLVLLKVGVQIGAAYFSKLRPIALYVTASVSLVNLQSFLGHCVFLSLWLMFLLWRPKVIMLSNVTPRILGILVAGIFFFGNTKRWQIINSENFNAEEKNAESRKQILSN